MPLAWLDHVNIRTANLEAMTRFYKDILGLQVGSRPPFGFNGSWLYCGDRAAVHLVETPKPSSGGESRIDHFAFRAEGLTDFLANLKTHDVSYRITTVPHLGLRQVNVLDPDGNHIEIAFPPNEKAV
ncbi:MAG: VOC family protein [Acidiferrobacterales bacterium]